MAIPRDAYQSIFNEPLGQLMVAKERLLLIVFDQAAEVIEQWIP